MTDCSSLCPSSRKPGKIHCAPLLLHIPLISHALSLPLLFFFFLLPLSWSCCFYIDTTFGISIVSFNSLYLTFSISPFFNSSNLLHCFLFALLPLFFFYPCESLFPSPLSHPLLSLLFHTCPLLPPLSPGLGTMQLSAAFSITPRPSPDESQVIGVVNLFTQRQFTAH